MWAEEIVLRRLRSHQLTGRPASSIDEVLTRLGAVQAQERAVSTWSIGLRAAGVRHSDVDRALADGTLVRSHLLRPTWHVVRAADLRWLTELTAPRVQAGNAYWDRRFGIDDELAARSTRHIAEAVADGRHQTRRELQALLRGHGIAVEGLTLGYLLMRAELELVICSGAPRGPTHTYALVAERVPAAPALDRDEAVTELVRRYYTSHGPATVKDFTWWSSLTATDARRALAALADELERTVVDGRTYWSAPAPPPPPEPLTAHLLQGFDEYVVAYSESKGMLDLDGHAGVVPAGQSMMTHALLVDGQVVGHWRRAGTVRSPAVEVQLGRPLTAAERAAVDTAVDRYGAFLGRPTTWTEL